jgi:hypothetical protein
MDIIYPPVVRVVSAYGTILYPPPIPGHEVSAYGTVTRARSRRQCTFQSYVSVVHDDLLHLAPPRVLVRIITKAAYSSSLDEAPSSALTFIAYAVDVNKTSHTPEAKALTRAPVGQTGLLSASSYSSLAVR